ncbi:cadherin-related family member 5 isoform X5 [Desmodus rotundus]|uniref:cadherin-related family member 5 isoform X5 n=1 Tax=Desmodus rotundus TaxID=9430 RepID=UPI002380E45C|nr:cadherin-related family member 5 isoform X5 [Desmodus rotundus]
MGAWALLLGAWALLLPGLPDVAQAQAQACSVRPNVFEVEENTKLSGPLVNVSVPEGQQVTLGPSSTPFAFRIQGTQLFLNVTPDYEENTVLEAHLECRRGDTLVTQQKVLVIVLDVNDNPPKFPFKVRVWSVSEDTEVNTVVIPEMELQAKDLDKNDILFYTLQEVTLGASSLFSLVGVNLPALRLDRPLDFDRHRNMTFQLMARDTREEDAVPSHTATATLVLEVQPADLRPPWFLPCVYSDSHFCLSAQYQGAIPTGHRLPAPLILRPGPIYAVDGDWGINQRIIYSLIRGQDEDDTFVINADSGNLTMTKSVPGPQTFLLLVKGEQEDHARYSVTQVTVEARDASGSPPRFPQSLYRGTVALGSGMGVAVKDAAAPSQPLRVWAQDPEFPDLNSAITYRITNNSNFQMDGEEVLTATQLVQAGVFYAEVEANNTVTSGTAATVLEIEVTELEPTPTGPPGTGGGTGGVPPGGSHVEDQRFSVTEMAALGGVLGALLLLAVIALAILVHKHYGPLLQCCSGKALEPQGFDNKAFLAKDGEASWAPAPSPRPTRTPAEVPPASPLPTLPAPASPGPALESPTVARDEGGPAGVRSILTKERRPEGGYKAVWFSENIGAEADVVVLNAPTMDADRASDSGSEGSGDESNGAAGVGEGPGSDSTSI